LATYRIVCVAKLATTGHPDHLHIQWVGAAPDGGERPTHKAGVGQVRRMIDDDSEAFYTMSPKAKVRPVTCGTCQTQTIETVGDKVPGNNLDELPECSLDVLDRLADILA
jgi:hypothetical protein